MTKRRKYCLIVGGTVILAIVLLFCFIPYYIRSHFLLSENEVLAGLEARYEFWDEAFLRNVSGYNGVAGNTHHPQGSCSSTMASRGSSTVEALSVHAASTAGVLDCSPVFPAAPNTFCGGTADYRTGDGHSVSDQYTLQWAV